MRNKYGAIKTTVDGITFHSKGEAGRYGQLKLMQKAKLIKDLKLQPKFPIEYQGHKICTAIFDFEYIEKGQWIAEDFKGFQTSVSRLKFKLAQAFYPTCEFRIVRKSSSIEGRVR